MLSNSRDVVNLTSVLPRAPLTSGRGIMESFINASKSLPAPPNYLSPPAHHHSSTFATDLQRRHEHTPQRLPLDRHLTDSQPLMKEAMADKYPVDAAGYYEGTMSLDDLQLGMDQEREGFDMQSYLEYEAPQWFQYEDDMTSPSSDSVDNGSQSGSRHHSISHSHSLSKNSSSQSHSSSQSSSPSKKGDPEISRLNRRRAQNRQSQKQFRERKQKAYDEVVAQLGERDHVIRGLKDEICVLNHRVLGLQQEKQQCLDAVMRLCRGMADGCAGMATQGYATVPTSTHASGGYSTSASPGGYGGQ